MCARVRQIVVERLLNHKNVFFFLPFVRSFEKIRIFFFPFSIKFLHTWLRTSRLYKSIYSQRRFFIEPKYGYCSVKYFCNIFTKLYSSYVYFFLVYLLRISSWVLYDFVIVRTMRAYALLQILTIFPDTRDLESRRTFGHLSSQNSQSLTT